MSPFTSAGLQIYLGPGLSTVEGTSVTRSTLSRDALRYFLEFTYRWFGCGSHNWFAYSNNFLLIKPYADWRRLPRDVPSVQAVKPRSHQSERLVRRRVPPQGRRERERLLTMTFPILFNPLFQMTAAFVIFFAGFITLFSFIALCVVIGWALYRCTTRLALLISRSHEETAPLVSNVASSNTVAGIRGQPVQSPPLPG
jgi:hypothetical protein